jgi:hypothetical protein
MAFSVFLSIYFVDDFAMNVEEKENRTSVFEFPPRFVATQDRETRVVDTCLTLTGSKGAWLPTNLAPSGTLAGGGMKTIGCAHKIHDSVTAGAGPRWVLS